MSYSWGDNQTNHLINNDGFKGKRLNVGLAVQHFNSPTYLFISEDRIGMRYVGSFNSSFGINNTNFAIQPSGFVALQNNALDAVFGSVVRYSLNEESKITESISGAAVSLGCHYRALDAFIASFLLEVGPIGIGFSYDFNASSLTTVSQARDGFELSIRYLSPTPFGGTKSQARFF